MARSIDLLVISEAVSDIADMLKQDESPEHLYIITDALAENGFDYLADAILKIANGGSSSNDLSEFKETTKQFKKDIAEFGKQIPGVKQVEVTVSSVDYFAAVDLIFDKQLGLFEYDEQDLIGEVGMRIQNTTDGGLEVDHMYETITYFLEVHYDEEASGMDGWTTVGTVNSLEEAMNAFDSTLHDLISLCYCFVVGWEIADQSRRSMYDTEGISDNNVHAIEKIKTLRQLKKFELLIGFRSDDIDRVKQAIIDIPRNIKEVNRTIISALEEVIGGMERHRGDAEADYTHDYRELLEFVRNNYKV